MYSTIRPLSGARSLQQTSVLPSGVAHAGLRADAFRLQVGDDRVHVGHEQSDVVPSGAVALD